MLLAMECDEKPGSNVQYKIILMKVQFLCYAFIYTSFLVIFKFISKDQNGTFEAYI